MDMGEMTITDKLFVFIITMMLLELAMKILFQQKLK